MNYRICNVDINLFCDTFPADLKVHRSGMTFLRSLFLLLFALLFLCIIFFPVTTFKHHGISNIDNTSVSLTLLTLKTVLVFY